MSSAANRTADASRPWYFSTLVVALAGSLMFWAALPPLGLAWLAWIAPVPWLLLARGERLHGRRPYGALWLAYFVFWLLAIHWIRLPHPALYVGWIALSGYLALYLPLFVGLTRIAVHRLRTPLWIAAPLVWTGLELARAHVMTGFLMGSLAHTQVHWTQLIQVSDLVGEYGVDFVVMLVAACVAMLVPVPQSSKDSRKWRPLALLPAVVVLAAALVYGHWRISNAPSPIGETFRIALIQGNSPADWKMDEARRGEIMQQYGELSEQAIAKSRQQDGRPVDLVVWPETMFRTSLVSFAPGFQLPPGAGRTIEEIESVGPRDLANLVAKLGTPVLVGVDRLYLLAPDAATAASSAPSAPRFLGYNSSALVGRDGKIIGTYDKVHLVMFGEYIPFAKWLPFLYQVSVLTGGVESGAGPVGLHVDENFCVAPNICYETAIPHVIRNQRATLEARGETPNVLVNLTNDAWYWGSSELDMHLACGVFRAVECRTPLVVAANSGISAWVDRFGRVLAESPRLQPDVLLADIDRQPLRSWYSEVGDWFACGCLTYCVVLAIIGWRGRRKTTNDTPTGD